MSFFPIPANIYSFRLFLELRSEDVNDNALYFDGGDFCGEIVFQVRENEPTEHF